MASHTANVAQLIPAKERADLCTFELDESIGKKVTLSREKRRVASPPGKRAGGPERQASHVAASLCAVCSRRAGCRAAMPAK